MKINKEINQALFIQSSLTEQNIYSKNCLAACKNLKFNLSVFPDNEELKTALDNLLNILEKNNFSQYDINKIIENQIN